ncbi:MAG: hypothetical protein WBF08_09520, partial [Candidatus Bathyarchaeia archaeon]
MMTNKKPENITEYSRWLKDKHGVLITNRTEAYYNTVASQVKSDFEGSDFWNCFTQNLKEYDDEYLLQTRYSLLRDTKPLLLIKPYVSTLMKTYRKNVVDNKNWPKEPIVGWILPNNWFLRINDIIRTLIEVKYLDGVEFLIEKIKTNCQELNIPCRAILEAREEGYYAAHLYIKKEFEIPKVTWDTEKIELNIEIQITTQLQEVIRKLLHNYYEDRRKKARSSGEVKWQWNYKSDEFTANYLGHILHYVEGMIVEIKDK